jgi:hypothetical protein
MEKETVKSKETVNRTARQAGRRYEVPDLQTQFEEILNTVWRAEANWRLDDRLDMALKIRRAE